MSKRLKGLYQDTLAIDQPPETYRSALNANLNMKIGGIVTEEGSRELSTVIPSGSICIGSTVVNDKRTILFFTNESGFSEIGSFQNGIYTTILNSIDLNFKINSIISSTIKMNIDREYILYWTDGINPPRRINIDSTPVVNNIDELNLFFTFDSAIKMDLNEVREYGGSLPTGSYQYAVAYLDKDGNKTNYVNITNPIRISSSDVGWGGAVEIEGNGGDSQSSCSVVLDISNIDTSYDRLVISAIHYFDGTIGSVRTLPSIKITTDTQIFVHSGQESYVDSSMEEIAINKTNYSTAKYITQQDDTLYLGNLTSDIDIGFQNFANNIEVHGVSKNITEAATTENIFINGGFEQGNPKIEYYNRSFRRDEPYAFYISLLLKSGGESKGYIIPGREAESNELSPLSGFSLDENERRFFQIDNDAKQFHYFSRKGSNGLAYWENEFEKYPDEDVFDVFDVNSSGEPIPHPTKPTLRGEPVRHHRFPEIANEYITEQDVSLNEHKYINILGVQFKNIKIPTYIKDQILGFKIYYAEKNTSNRLVLGNSLIIPQKTKSIGSEIFYINDIPKVTTGGSSGTSSSTTWAMHPFNLMRTHGGIGGIQYIKNYAEAGNRNTEGERVSGKETKVYASLYPTSYLSKDSNKRMRLITAKSYIQSNSDKVNIKGLDFTYDKSSLKEESQLLLEFDMALNQDWKTGKFDDREVKYGYLSTIHTHKKEVFNSFDQQILVWTGLIDTDLDKYDPSDSGYSLGEYATGSIEITSDAPSETPGVKSSATTTLLITPPDMNRNYNLEIGMESDYKNHVIIEPTDYETTIGLKIESLVNGDSNYPFTASYDVSNKELTFTAKVYGTAIDGDKIKINELGQEDLSGTNLSATPLTPSFNGGADPITGPEGVINIEFGSPYEGISAIVNYGDTKQDIIDKLETSFNTSPTSPNLYYDMVKEVSGVKLFFTAKNRGSSWNKLLKFSITTTSSVTASFIGLNGGLDPSSTLKENYGGDVFVGKYGVRFTTQKNSSQEDDRKFLARFVSEEIDNITLRYTGNNFAQLNPNLINNKKSILDYEEDDNDEDNDKWYDNFYGYDQSYSKLGDTKSAIPREKHLIENNNYPNRVIKSQEQDFSNLDRFRSFLENDYLDLPRNRGEITNLAILDNILIVHMERALFRTKGREQLVTGDFRAFLGSGNIFEIKPDELKSTTHGFAGTSSPKGTVEFEGGYFFVDDKSKKVYLLTEGIQNLSELGMRNFFKENLEWSIDQVVDHNIVPFVNISSEYDSEYNRILFTKVDYAPNQPLLDGIDDGSITFDDTSGKFKVYDSQTSSYYDIEYSNTTMFTNKSFTISYLPEIQAWVSFHSYTPLFYFANSTELFSIHNNKIHKHNDKGSLTKYCTYYGIQNPFHIQIVENPSTDISKQLVNIEYQLRNPSTSFNNAINFNKFRVRNDYQDSGENNIKYFTQTDGNARNIESTWRINKFRDMMDNGALNTSLDWYKQKRFIGKYVVIDLYYDYPTTNEITLISATANFKESIR